MHSLLSTVATAALLLSPAAAQTFTDCNPLKKSCPSDRGLAKKHWSADFVKHQAAAMKDWKTSGGTVTHGPKGAGFSIKQRYDAPTIQTKFDIFFGHVECTMLAAPGHGVVSSFILESSDLDEIDWEFIGSDYANGQSNFFGKGNTTTYDRGAYHPVQGPQTQRHTYAVDWTKDRIQWIINGKVVRTVGYHDALALNGRNYPQTPMHIRIGVWAGGDPKLNSPGTVQWAEGPIHYDQGPFTMYVEKVKVTNYNPAKAYKYGNRSGSYKSIKKLHSAARAEDGEELTNHPRIPNNRPGPAISYSTATTTSAPTYSYIPYSSTSAPYPIGNSTIVTAPHSTGGITYHPGTSTTLGGGSSTGPATSTPTAAANAVHAKVGGAVAGLLGVVALL